VSTFGGLDTFVNHVGPVRPHTGGFHSGSDDYSLATPRIDFLATVRTCARR
jgi:hypothetical protein